MGPSRRPSPLTRTSRAARRRTAGRCPGGGTLPSRPCQRSHVLSQGAARLHVFPVAPGTRLASEGTVLHPRHTRLHTVSKGTGAISLPPAEHGQTLQRKWCELREVAGGSRAKGGPHGDRQVTAPPRVSVSSSQMGPCVLGLLGGRELEDVALAQGLAHMFVIVLVIAAQHGSQVSRLPVPSDPSSAASQAQA